MGVGDVIEVVAAGWLLVGNVQVMRIADFLCPGRHHDDRNVYADSASAR